MDRRSFLKGTFGGVSAAGALILTATPADVAKFATETPLGTPVASSTLQTKEFGLPDYGEFVFNSQGMPIGVVTSINMYQDSVDVTMSHHENRQYMPGLKRIELSVSVIGNALVGHGKR